MKKFPPTKWLLPLVIILCLKALMLGMFISGIIGGNVAQAVEIDSDRVEVNGLNVTMTGFASQAEADAAELIASDEVAWTSNVEALVDGDSSPAQALAESEVNVAVGTGDVVLTGTVATGTVKTALLESAEAEFGPDRTVVDELVVDPDAVSVESGDVVVSGVANDDAERTEWIASGEALAAANSFSLVDEVAVADPVAAPVDDLNSLFALEPIEFDTSRASIRAVSQPTLDQAAQLINDNPDAGPFKVVGHTDSDGEDASNLALSQARADAVVDYLVTTGGVDAERLEPEGRGETELKVSPEESPEDKQRNRRIEWEQS